MATGLDQLGIFGVKQAGVCTFTSLATNKPELYIGFANSISLEMSSTPSYAKSQGVNAIAFDGQPEASLTINTEMTSFDLLRFIMGSPLKNQATDFYKRETVILKTEAEQITLKEDTIVADSVCVFELGADGNTQGAELETATVSGNKVTMTGGVTGNRYVIYYMTNKTASTFMVKAKKEITGFYKLSMICEGKTWASGEKALLQIVFNKVSPQPNLSIEFSAENPSSFEIVLDVLMDDEDNMFSITPITQ